MNLGNKKSLASVASGSLSLRPLSDILGMLLAALASFFLCLAPEVSTGASLYVFPANEPLSYSKLNTNFALLNNESASVSNAAWYASNGVQAMAWFTNTAVYASNTVDALLPFTGSWQNAYVYSTNAPYVLISATQETYRVITNITASATAFTSHTGAVGTAVHGLGTASTHGHEEYATAAQGVAGTNALWDAVTNWSYPLSNPSNYVTEAITNWLTVTESDPLWSVWRTNTAAGTTNAVLPDGSLYDISSLLGGSSFDPDATNQAVITATNLSWQLVLSSDFVAVASNNNYSTGTTQSFDTVTLNSAYIYGGTPGVEMTTNGGFDGITNSVLDGWELTGDVSWHPAHAIIASGGGYSLSTTNSMSIQPGLKYRVILDYAVTWVEEPIGLYPCTVSLGGSSIVLTNIVPLGSQHVWTNDFTAVSTNGLTVTGDNLTPIVFYTASVKQLYGGVYGGDYDGGIWRGDVFIGDQEITPSKMAAWDNSIDSVTGPGMSTEGGAVTFSTNGWVFGSGGSSTNGLASTNWVESTFYPLSNPSNYVTAAITNGLGGGGSTNGLIGSVTGPGMSTDGGAVTFTTNGWAFGFPDVVSGTNARVAGGWVPLVGTPLSKTNACAFSSTLSTYRKLAATAYTNVNCNTEQYDYAGCYNTTNGRFIPSKAGIYLFLYNATTETPEYFVVNIYKNGNPISSSSSSSSPAGNNYVTVGATMAYANGTTDYFEYMAYSTGGRRLYGDDVAASLTKWSGCLIAGD